MSKETVKIVGLVASATLVAGAMPVTQVLAGDVSDVPNSHQATIQANNIQARDNVRIPNIKGIFNYNQGVSASNEQLARNIFKATDVLCGTRAVETPDEAAITALQVTGAVGKEFFAQVADYNKNAPVKKIMGCTCKGNPAGGLASANAEVSGFRLAALIRDAEPSEGANAITFISQDGYRVTLPLFYVLQHNATIVSFVNGENTSEAVGCSNQLWLGSTSARYYAQNIVAIEISKQAQDPPAPGTPEFANLPNVGVFAGE